MKNEFEICKKAWPNKSLEERQKVIYATSSLMPMMKKGPKKNYTDLLEWMKTNLNKT